MKLRPYFLVILALAALGLLVAPSLIMGAPRESSMGLVQKIFYYHVPVAMTTFLGAFVCAWGSGLYLFKGSERGDQLAVSAAELTVLFGSCMLVTGPLWGRKAWGVWWQWDVRLTTALLLWMIFIAYLFARKYGGPGSKKLAAALALFGAADVPLIYFSVSIWRTIHPKATVIPSVAKDKGMGVPFFVSWVTITLLFLVLLEMRVALERARARVDELHLAAEDAGLES
ncbi:MAG TPA: cytochrome c biogenesis protein CcsA [Polyangia bacterium]|nr:cytochrome c biogenesis protein CcsA [Polyangia bacterium]